MSKTQRWVFTAFAFASFARVFILILNLLGLAPWSWLTLLHVMVAPQTIVFADPLFYEPIHLCQVHGEGPPNCTTRYDYIKSTSGPYILNGAVFNHALIFYQSFKNEPLGELGAMHLRQRFCAPGVTGLWIEPEPNGHPKPHEARSYLVCANEDD